MPNIEVDKLLQVAVGVIEKNGKFLLTRRDGVVHLSGLWEFPGGKLERGESAGEALIREFNEELGILVLVSERLLEIPFDYPDRQVRLHVFRILKYEGEIVRYEQQPLRWVSWGELQTIPLPAANRGILAALALPRQYLITPEPADTLASFLDQLESRLLAGIRLVQLRARCLSGESLTRLAKAAVTRCHAVGAKLILNGDPALALSCGADGVHLTAQDAIFKREVIEKYWISNGLLVGVSCHNRQELEQAVKIGADYVLCSPVRQTQSHPGLPAMGWKTFTYLCTNSPVPVYALGGMGPADEERVRAAGGYGVAGIRAFWAV